MPIDYQSSVKERLHKPAPGLLALLLLLIALIICAVCFISGMITQHPVFVVTAVLGGIVTIFLLNGIVVVNPNEAKVLVLFGKYVGTIREAGM